MPFCTSLMQISVSAQVCFLSMLLATSQVSATLLSVSHLPRAVTPMQPGAVASSSADLGGVLMREASSVLPLSQFFPFSHLVVPSVHLTSGENISNSHRVDLRMPGERANCRPPLPPRATLDL